MATPARICRQLACNTTHNLSGFTSGAYVPFEIISGPDIGGITNPTSTRLLVPRAGNYLIDWHIGIHRGASSITPSFDVETVLHVNGAATFIKAAGHQLDTTAGDFSGRQGVSCTCIYNASASDYFEIWLRTVGAVNGVTGHLNTSGGALEGICRTYFSVTYLDDAIPCIHAVQDAETDAITGTGWGDLTQLSQVYASNKLSKVSNRYVYVYEDGLYVMAGQAHVVNDASGAFDCRLRSRFSRNSSGFFGNALAGDYRYGTGVNNASNVQSRALIRLNAGDYVTFQRNIDALPGSGNTYVAGKSRVTAPALTMYKASRPGVVTNFFDRNGFVIDGESVGSQPVTWTYTSDDTNNTWHVSDKRVRTLMRSFRLGDSSGVFYGHDASMTATLLSPSIYLPTFGESGYTTYYLRFHVFLACGTSGAFNLNVQTLNSSTPVGTYDVDASVGYFTGYKFASFSVDIGSSMNGSSAVQVKFTFTSSASALTLSELWEGVYIDDLRIEGE